MVPSCDSLTALNSPFPPIFDTCSRSPPPVSQSDFLCLQHSITCKMDEQVQADLLEAHRIRRWTKVEKESAKDTIHPSSGELTHSTYKHMHRALSLSHRALECWLCWGKASGCGNEGNSLAKGRRPPPPQFKIN